MSLRGLSRADARELDEAISKDEIPRGVYPEQNNEILHFPFAEPAPSFPSGQALRPAQGRRAQNDMERRTWNDSLRAFSGGIKGLKGQSYFCLNPSCEDYAVVGRGNIIFRRYYGPHDTALFQCRTCKKTFSEDSPSPLLGLHPIQQTRRIFVKPKQKITISKPPSHKLGTAHPFI